MSTEDSNNDKQSQHGDSQPTTHYNVNQYFQNIHYNDVEKVVDAVHSALEKGGLESFDDGIDVEANSLSAAEAAVAAYHAQQSQSQAVRNQVLLKKRKLNDLRDDEHAAVAQIAEAVAVASSFPVDKTKDTSNEFGERVQDTHVDPTANTYFNLINVPEDADPKRICKFCGKTFAHPGSLGRHLDSRKGTKLHPAEAIDLIRSNVYRRGDPVAVKARRAARARNYNRRDYVMEKNRERRKVQSKIYRVKEAYLLNFLKSVSVPVLPPHPSFPRMVLFFLPPSKWPHDPPTFQTFETLSNWLNNPELSFKLNMLTDSLNADSYKEKLNTAYENWKTLSGDTKKDIWIREQRICAQEALGNLTLFDFAIKHDYADSLASDRKMQLKKSEGEGSVVDSGEEFVTEDDNHNEELGDDGSREEIDSSVGDTGLDDSIAVEDDKEPVGPTSDQLAAVVAAVAMKAGQQRE